MAKDPRFTGNEDMRLPAAASGLRLENVDVLKIGESGDPLDKEYTAARWFELYGKTSIANSAAKLMVLDFEVAGASQATPAMASTLHVTFTDSHTSEKAFNGGEAIYAETVADEADTGASIGNIGYICAIQARLTITAASKNVAFGPHYALFLVNNFGAGLTVGGEFAFMGFRDRGAVKTPNLWDTVLIGSVSDGAWETTAGAVSTVLGYYKIRTVAGAGYLVVYASHGA